MDYLLSIEHPPLPIYKREDELEAPPLPPKLTTFMVNVPKSPSTTPLPASPLGEDNPLIAQCQRMLEDDGKRAEERSLLAHEDEFSDEEDQEPIPPPRCIDALEAQMEEDLEGDICDNEVVIIDNRMPSPILKAMTPPASNPGTSPSTPNQETLPREIAAASPKCVRFNMEPEITHFEKDSPQSDNGMRHYEGGNSYEELLGLTVERTADCPNEPGEISISAIARQSPDVIPEGSLLYLADAGCQTDCAAQEIDEHSLLLADEEPIEIVTEFHDSQQTVPKEGQQEQLPSG